MSELDSRIRQLNKMHNDLNENNKTEDNNNNSKIEKNKEIKSNFTFQQNNILNNLI